MCTGIVEIASDIFRLSIFFQGEKLLFDKKKIALSFF